MRDPFLGIMQEIGAAPRTLVGDDAPAPLTDLAKDVAKPVTTPPNDYFGHLLAAHATQYTEERARREAAEKEVQRTKSWLGWSVAGALSLVLVYFLARRK